MIGDGRKNMFEETKERNRRIKNSNLLFSIHDRRPEGKIAKNENERTKGHFL